MFINDANGFTGHDKIFGSISFYYDIIGTSIKIGTWKGVLNRTGTNSNIRPHS